MDLLPNFESILSNTVEKFDNKDTKKIHFSKYTERDSKVGIWAEAKALAVKQSQKGPYY